MPGVHQFIGVTVFIAMALAAWNLGWHSRRANAHNRTLMSTAGALLIAPFALIGLFWVGLGTPWQATPSENMLRYVVLTIGAIAEVVGFVMAREALAKAGERFFATLSVSAILLAGPLHVIWSIFNFGLHSAREATGEIPSVFMELDQVLDVVLFFSGALTYFAAAFLAVALGKVKWLGRASLRVFASICGLALFFLLQRGMNFITPAELSDPWYVVPGFIVGIPAVPYLLPCLMGAIMLHRSDDN